MAQFVRPIQDISIASWRTQSGGTTNLWQTIDEDTADSVDFVTQQTGAANDTYEVRLGAATTPLIRRYHIVRYEYRKHQALGNVRNLQVALVEGTRIVATGTLHTDISVVWVPGAFQLTIAEAATITDYSNLRLRFIATGTTSGSAARRQVQVSFAQLRVPDWQPTYENEWGAIEDLSTPGVFRYTLDGVTGEGPRREDALVDLWEKLRDIQPTDPVRERRWKMAYYSRKTVDYTAYRQTVVAGAFPPHQTQNEALAIVDAKLSAFSSITASADAGDRL